MARSTRTQSTLFPREDSDQTSPQEKPPLPCISHPSPLVDLAESIRTHITYQVRTFSIRRYLIPPTFPYEPIFHPNRKSVDICYYEFRSTTSPLMRVGFMGDIWITISQGGLHEVHYKVGEIKWERWEGCASSALAASSSTRVYKPVHPLLSSFHPWPTDEHISWRMPSTIQRQCTKMRKSGFHAPFTSSSQKLVPSDKQILLPTAHEVVVYCYGLLLRTGVKRKKTQDPGPMTDDEYVPPVPRRRPKRSRSLIKQKKTCTDTGGYGPISSSPQLVIDHLSKGVCGIPSTPTAAADNATCSGSELRYPFRSRRNTGLSPLSCLSSSSGPGPHTEVIVISDDEGDVIYDPVENFLCGLPLPASPPGKSYQSYFYDDNIYTEQDLDIVARLPVAILSNYILTGLKAVHLPSWATIMAALDRRKQDKNLG